MDSANKQITHIKDLKPDQMNPRRRTERNLQMIEASLNEVGAARSIVVDEDGNILAGNGTVEAAALAGIEKVKVVEADGNTIIAVRRSGLTEEQKRRLSIYDNRTAELAEWDAAVLACLEDENHGITKGMFTDEELVYLINGALEGGCGETTVGDAGPQIDKADELRAKWGVELGQLWDIDGHLLWCGDSMQELPFAAPRNLFYDPPWNADVTPVWEYDAALAFCDGRFINKTVAQFGAPNWLFTWDCVTSWYAPNRPLQRAKYCAFYGDITQYNFNGAHYDDGKPLTAHTVKNTRGEFNFVPDPLGKHLSDVFQMGITTLHGDGDHKHEKPIDWVRLLVGNCFTGNLFDPFAGSGASFVAAQQLGRVCYGAEIEPRFVALILQRLHDMGLTPHLERTI